MAGIGEQCRLAFGAWPPSWRAQVLESPPLIAPARQFTYPLQIAGEEDALARGALQMLVNPRAGGSFLATCALGFTSEAVPTGALACPDADQLCAVAGGYVYLIDTLHPARSTHLPLKPVADLLVLPAHQLLIFVGFHSIMAWGRNGLAWQTARLSWEGIRVSEVEGNTLHGSGWNMHTDKDVEFAVDLRSGQHTGGGF